MNDTKNNLQSTTNGGGVEAVPAGLEWRERPVGEVLAMWLSRYNSPATRRAYGDDVRAYLASAGMVTAGEVLATSPADAMAAVGAFLASHRRTVPGDAGRIENPRTVNRKAASVSAFYEFLRSAGAYPVNPVKLAHRKVREPGYSTTASLSRGQLSDLLRIARDRVPDGQKQHRDYLALACLFGLAMRVSELASVRWPDIDLAAGVVTTHGKGGKALVKPLPPALVASFAEYREKYGQPSAFVFAPFRGRGGAVLDKRPDPTAFRDVVRDAARRAGIEKPISPHSLRKTFVELALADNVPVTNVMRGTGHGSPAMVAYYDQKDAREHNAINDMAKFL